MKAWFKSAASALRFHAWRASLAVAALLRVLLAPIGFREVLLLSGAGLLGAGASMIYPPAGFVVAGLILAGVAVFGVRA